MTEREKDTERWRHLLHGHLDGTLSAKESAELERAIIADPAAAAELESFSRLASLSRSARPAPPEDFASRVMASISRPEVVRRQGRTTRGFFGSLFPRLDRWSPALGGALAMAVLALLLGRFVARPVPPERIAPESTSLVTHSFELAAPAAGKVCLVGTFNDWKVCEAPLVLNPETGTWSVEVQLPPGRHEYMFVVDDGDWVTDPGADTTVDDGFGHENAVVFL